LIHRSIVATASENNNGTCDFADDEHTCGYVVGSCWQTSLIAYFDAASKPPQSALFAVVRCRS